MTEHDYNRRMEIEAKMAEDKEHEAQRVAKASELAKGVQKPVASAIRRVAMQGAVRRPLTPRVGRGF